jgi:hypothetical protein
MTGEGVGREEGMMTLLILLRYSAVSHLQEAGIGVGGIEEDIQGPGLDLGLIEDIGRVRLLRRKLIKMVIEHVNLVKNEESSDSVHNTRFKDNNE